MKTFSTFFEEIKKQTEEDFSVDDTRKISTVVERIKEIVSGASDSSPEGVVDELESALSEFALTFDKEKALAALAADEMTELSLSPSGEGEPFVIDAIDDETGEEIPGDMVLALHKDGEGIYAKVHVYFDDNEPELLDDLKFHIPDEEESGKEKEEEGWHEDYPADEEEDTYKEKKDDEKREVGGRVNQLGGVEEEDEDDEEDSEECHCKDKENCTCKKKKKEDSDDIEGGGEHESRVSSGGAEVTKKGSVEVYEEYTGGTKYVVVHVKNNKLKADIIDHKLDAYNQGLNIVGDIIEITPKEVHDTESRMRELSKLKRKKVADAKKKLAAKMEAKKVIADSKKEPESPEVTGKKSPVINDIMNKDDQKKFKKKMEREEKKGENLPEPAIHQI